MTVERVNPEVVLKAAQVAGVPRGLESRFMPQTNGEDAWALERSLKKEGWEFSYEQEEFQAAREHSMPIMVGNMPGQEIATELLYDPSDTLLLLKAVSSQFSIPLYLED